MTAPITGEPSRPFPPKGHSPLPTAYDPAVHTTEQPARSRRRPAWLIAGVALLAIAVLQLLRLPEWPAMDERGVIGNVTGVIALVGIGTALLITGRERRRRPLGSDRQATGQD